MENYTYPRLNTNKFKEIFLKPRYKTGIPIRDNILEYTYQIF